MFIPTPGRIVEYTLDGADAGNINKRRVDARNNKAVGETGFVLCQGNEVQIGEKFPLVITRAWGRDEDSAVNGQVLLDGNDTLWVTSVYQGPGQRQFRPYPRV